MADQMTGIRIEQRALLRSELVPQGATIVVRGGSDTRDKLRRHAERTARAWSLDGQPLLGVSVFAVLDVPTGQRPHFTIRLRGASDAELDRLLAALGDLRPNSQYANGGI
jgi:hypothetical protein